MLRFLLRLLFSTTRLICRVTAVLVGLVLSSLGGAAFAFLHTSPSKEKEAILGTYDAQHALNEGSIDAPEFEYYRERYED